MSLQPIVFIAQRLDGARPTREFRAGQNGSNQPFSHGKYAENKNALVFLFFGLAGLFMTR
jgi:hypothetical protein